MQAGPTGRADDRLRVTLDQENGGGGIMPLNHDSIRLRRERLRLTQEAAADRAGIHQPHWARLEAGRVQSPRLDTLQRLAAALECEVGELLLRNSD